MSLLSQKRIDSLIGIAERRVERVREVARAQLFADGDASSPPGMVNLDTPEAVAVFGRYLSRQSEREQRGVVPGDLNRTMADHPAVQQMTTEQ